MMPARCDPGASHENGSVESAHDHIEWALKDESLCRAACPEYLDKLPCQPLEGLALVRQKPDTCFLAQRAPPRISPSSAFFAANGRASTTVWSCFVRRVVAILIHKFAPSSQSPGIQRSVDCGALNSAAGFMIMSAIAEPAKRGQLRNFREQGADAMGRIADVESAHSRRINHPATARNGVNRARGRSMASFRVVFANLPGLLRQ